MSNFVTQSGLIALQNEFKEIQEVKVPAMLAGLNEALSAGDLSENAARDTLLTEQQALNSRLQEIEDILNDYEIIDEEENTVPVKSRLIRIGSTVKIEYPEEKKSYTIKIMGNSEANVLDELPKISNESPLAAAILNKKIGDEVVIRFKQKKMAVKILDILD